jgi:pyruvyltransferase
VAVRTFFWDPVPPRRALRRRRGFRHGNAGDRFNIDLIEWAYPGEDVVNVDDEGGRLLLVGSVAHRVLDGDVVNGIGCKTTDLPTAGDVTIRARGVRGPLTLDALAAAGHDVSGVLFQGDPGLLIGKVHPDLLTVEAERGRVVFIPHYRERDRYRSDRRYRVVDIDAPPVDVGREIRRAEVVHTSSLHGLVWAHALGRPARLVAPQTPESPLKYEDYLLSIGQPTGAIAPDIDASLRTPTPTTPVDVTAVIATISLPPRPELP